MFSDALARGRALLLLDGLDEMLTAHERAAVASAIAAFSREYPTARIVVTSRIAGYSSGLLPGNFTTLTAAPFDDEAITRFAQQWSLAFETTGVLPHQELSSDVR